MSATDDTKRSRGNLLKSGLSGFKDLVGGLRGFFSTDEVDKYYTLKEVLGQGAFAEVRRAIEKKTGTEVAIKCISKSGKTNVKLMEQECEVLNKVRHKNCVSVVEIFDTKDMLYLVMELVTGGELFERISEKERFSEAEAALYIKDILSGLEYLHAIGIVHRDLKPENLLFENDGPNASLKITDFGLSKLMTGKRQFLDSRCGTPAYVAPEILLGEQYGPKVDLWAVGVITYLLLAGYPPFWGDTMEELFDRIIDADFAFHAQYWSSVSNEGMHFVEQLLEPKVDKRYSATDALKHPWILKAKPKMPSLSSMYGLRVYRNNRQATAASTFEAQRAAATASSKASTAATNTTTTTDNGNDDDERDPDYDPNASAPASSSSSATAAPPVDPLAESRVLDSWKHFLDETKETRKAVGASLESSAHADARQRQLAGRAEVPLAPLLTLAASFGGGAQLARVAQKYPRWPDYSEAFYRGRLTGTYDTSLVLEELAKGSRWKDRAMEIGYVRPFLMLVSMHPIMRLAVASTLGVDIISKVWYGDSHHEAWDIINADKGMRARTVKVSDKALRDLLGITCWYDTMWRVTEKTLSHRKTAVDLRQKVTDYEEFLSQFGRDALIAACKSGPQIDVVENLETEWFLALLRRLHEFRGTKGRGATSVPQLFASLDDVRNSSGAALHMLENFEMAGVRAESLIVYFANYYFGERYMKDSDEGTFQLWLQKERQTTASSVLLGKLDYGILMPAVFMCLFQRTALSASGVPLIPFYPDSRTTL